LEYEARDNERVIAALKYANDERDKMIKSLMEDIVELKNRVAGQVGVSWEWKNEVERRDATIEALKDECRELRYSIKE